MRRRGPSSGEGEHGNRRAALSDYPAVGPRAGRPRVHSCMLERMSRVRDEQVGRLIVVCGLPGSGKTMLAERLALGAAVELRFLEESVDVLWARVRTRGRPGDRGLSRGDIESYAARIQRPDTEELALYDPPLIY